MSVTMLGIFVSALSFLFQKSGLEISQNDVATFVAVGAQIVGLALAWVGRYRQGDVTPLGVRK